MSPQARLRAFAMLVPLAVLALLAGATTLPAQENDRIPVMTLGTFHFNFPNLDARTVGRDDQIDVLEAKYQAEIEDIVGRLAQFRPTIIAIERQPDRQGRIDSAYAAYLTGAYNLGRGEEEQIGFRLGKACGIRKLWCVDEWGAFAAAVAPVVEGTDTLGATKFEDYYYHNPDSAKRTNHPPTFKTEGIRNELILLNDPVRVKESLGDYLVGIFKYEAVPGDFLGADFETGRWFSRNLRIFRNIQRIPASRADRIVVIFGAGHLNLLNIFFDSSPEYQLTPAGSWLK